MALSYADVPADHKVVRRTALITGAARGLGAATARAIASRGWLVAAADIDREGVNRTAEDCARMSPGSISIVADLTGENGPQVMVEEMVRVCGRIDLLVNCAAVSRVEPFLAMSSAAWDTSLTINVRAVALAMSVAGRIMVTQGTGHIVNVTSVAARMALPHNAAYAASKAAVDALTRAGAVTLAPHGVRVNSISPGMMDTPLQEENELALCRLEGRADFEAFKSERTSRIPLGRRTSVEEMADAIVWLAIDSPHYMTAGRINISGGLDKD